MVSTSLEQSRRLIALGLDIETSDMVWQSIEDDESFDGTWEVIPKENSLNVGYKDDVPAWSLTAFFKLLPTECCVGIIGRDYYYASEPYGFLTDDYKEPVEAAYHLVMHLLQDGYKYDSKTKTLQK